MPGDVQALPENQQNKRHKNGMEWSNKKRVNEKKRKTKRIMRSTANSYYFDL